MTCFELEILILMNTKKTFEIECSTKLKNIYA